MLTLFYQRGLYSLICATGSSGPQDANKGFSLRFLFVPINANNYETTILLSSRMDLWQIQQ